MTLAYYICSGKYRWHQLTLELPGLGNCAWWNDECESSCLFEYVDCAWKGSTQVLWQRIVVTTYEPNATFSGVIPIKELWVAITRCVGVWWTMKSLKRWWGPHWATLRRWNRDAFVSPPECLHFLNLRLCRQSFVKSFARDIWSLGD